MLVNLVLLLTFYPYSATAAVSLKGIWHLQDRKNASALLESAINNAVKGMNFFVRTKGRKILRNETNLCYTWSLAATKKDFIWQCNSEDVSRLSLKANKLRASNHNNEIIKSTYKEENNSISVTFESSTGKRVYSWSIVHNNYIEFTTKIERKGIPKSLEWTLIYSRIMR